MKVLVACGAGMGSSQLIKMTASKVLKELGVDANLEHTAIDEARSIARSYDLVIVNERFVSTLPTDVKVIGLKNLLNKAELKTKLLEAGIGHE